MIANATKVDINYDSLDELLRDFFPNDYANSESINSDDYPVIGIQLAKESIEKFNDIF